MSLSDHGKQLIIIKTDKGRYAVRPMTWACIFNKNGHIREDMNHIAIFSEEEDAKEYVNIVDRSKPRYSELNLIQVINNLTKFCPIQIYYNGTLIYNDECHIGELMIQLLDEYIQPLVHDIMIEIVQYHHSIIRIKGEELKKK